MSDRDEKLSPDASPKIMEVKTKRARRINNRPVFIAFVIFGIIALTLGLVVVSRSGKAKAEIGKTTVKSSNAFAKEVIAMGDSVANDPPAPASAPPLRDETQPKEEDAPKNEPSQPLLQSGIKTEPPKRMSEEERKIREKRWRQVEAAIDGPIKAQIGEVKTTPRTISAELAEVERQIAALGNNGSAQVYAERLAAIRAELAGGGGGGTDYSRRGDLSRMNQFSGATDWTNPATVEAPSTMHIIRTGSVIPATLISGINSDLPGQIVGQVAQDVYDTPTGKHILIPQGSRLVGEYSSDVQYGQSRVFAVWQRVIFPDGKALDLGAMPGSSGAGYSGFRDRVNNHYFRIFGSAIMMSAILAGVEMTQDDNNSTGNTQRMSDAMSEALGQQLGGVMAEMLQKNMNIAPTLEIRPGYRFNVMLVKDLVFPGSYSGFDYTRQ